MSFSMFIFVLLHFKLEPYVCVCEHVCKDAKAVVYTRTQICKKNVFVVAHQGLNLPLRKETKIFYQWKYCKYSIPIVTLGLERAKISAERELYLPFLVPGFYTT